MSGDTRVFPVYQKVLLFLSIPFVTVGLYGLHSVLLAASLPQYTNERHVNGVVDKVGISPAHRNGHAVIQLKDDETLYRCSLDPCYLLQPGDTVSFEVADVSGILGQQTNQVQKLD